MKNIIVSILLVLPLLLYNCTSSNRPPIIDREIFFGEPEISQLQLSPNGNYMAYLRPYKGHRNIWIKPFDADFADSKPITNEHQSIISEFFWSRDGRYIVYLQDYQGDDNLNIFVIDLNYLHLEIIPQPKNITDIQGVRAEIYHISRIDSDLIFIGLNIRDRAWHDLYSLRLSTGELELIKKNTQRYQTWVLDYEDNLRLATEAGADGINRLWRIDADGNTLLYSWDIYETVYPPKFAASNEHIYLISNVGDSVNFTKLYQIEVATGGIELIEGDPEGEVDLDNFFLSNRTLELLYTTYVDDYTRRYFFNSDYERHYRKVAAQFEGMEVNLYGATADERLWLVNPYSDINPGMVYLYDSDSGNLSFLYELHPELPTQHLSPMRSIRYPSSDGTVIQAYLTIPKGYREKDLPLVVLPHGGPWWRDYWGYCPYVQFLANRGYAVLQPNFRASSGFGKEFYNAGNLEWGEMIQDDITWGIEYLIGKGIVDPVRVGIFGESFGGYAALAGLAFTPNLYACGVSLGGPSNLITLLNSIPPYWESLRKVYFECIGDPTTEEGTEQLKRQSPFFHADSIIAPLLVAQGQNDPRVRKTESDQIVVALRERGFPVEYIVAPNEGHGFFHPINRKAFIAAMESFLAQHLGGRYQDSIPPEIRKRLKEITVDIRTVELPKSLGF